MIQRCEDEEDEVGASEEGSNWNETRSWHKHRNRSNRVLGSSDFRCPAVHFFPSTLLERSQTMGSFFDSRPPSHVPFARTVHISIVHIVHIVPAQHSS